MTVKTCSLTKLPISDRIKGPRGTMVNDGLGRFAQSCYPSSTQHHVVNIVNGDEVKNTVTLTAHGSQQTFADLWV